jgi:hypothetical protein
MGNYNPHAPHILGHEWVGITNAHYVMDEVSERGYTFTIDHTTTPVSGAFYVHEMPGNLLAQACDFIAIYPAGRETQTGPIKRVLIPASAVIVTNPGSIDITAGVAALFNPEDDKNIVFDNDTGIASQLQVSFNTEAFAALLLGKRIVDVRIRYSFTSFNTANAENLTFRIHNQASFKGVIFPEVTEVVSNTAPGKISTLSVTELNPTWDSTANFRGQRTVLPWRLQELNRFRSGAAAAEALTIFIQNEVTLFAASLRYLELEVLYCEETRVLYGGFRTYDNSFANFPALLSEYYNIGAIATRLYSPVTFTQGTTLNPGEYTVTIYHRNMASKTRFQGTPEIHAVREYYQLPNQRAIHIRQTTVPGAQFTVEDAKNIITHLTLHTATSVVTGVHAYGTAAGAAVYGSQTVIQEIEDNPTAGGTYPQVRFYARRYGNTTVPLTLVDVATGLSTVSISVTDFDALEEIVDGWREVTLRFATPPTFPVTVDDIDWRWQATGESAGNQWQIMVTDGPTGAWQPNPTAAATGPATYWAPLGATVGLTWQSPTISGVAFDSTSDAVLIFSQDPPAVTGFALEELDQQLNVALRCDVTPRCVPTALAYQRVSWNALGVCDDFDVADAAGWPDTDSEQVWDQSGGNTATDYVVADGRGQHVLNTVNVVRNSTASVDPGVSLTEVVVAVGVSQIATGDTIFAGTGIGVDTANIYQARLQFRTTGNVHLEVVKRVGGAQTTIFTAAVVGTYAPGDLWMIRTRWVAGVIYARAWPALLVEPQYWSAVIADASLTTFTAVVMRSQTGAASTNVSPIVYWDDLSATHAGLVAGSLEIQRRDAYDADWQTIMLSTRPGCVASFADYEPRVGVSSEYRMRTLNALDFAGPWVTGAATLTSPGVSVAGGSGGVNSVLIFTSNAQPDAGLAYVMQWENRSVEQFSFPEADTVALQRMFERDYFVAVHPLERGGEQFERVILVNYAAVAVPSLANVRELRDLAWADLDYVCVRDELGNRWFAAVVVPAGEVRGDRTIYLVRIIVTKVTDTPTPVDP